MNASPYVLVKVDGQLWIEAYEKFWPANYSPIQIELECYKENRDASRGGIGTYGHMRRAHDLIFPPLANTWFSWKEQLFEAGCAGEPYISLVGAKGTAKTAGMAAYSLIWLWSHALGDFLSTPQRMVLACSTTIGAMDERFFRYLRSYRAMARQAAPFLPGKIVNAPKPALYFGEGETKASGIVAKAIKPGSAESIAGEFLGIHPEGGVLLFVDEGQKLVRNATPGLNEAIANLSKRGKLQVVVAGNPQDRHNFHAHVSEPAHCTFDELDPDRDQWWRTKVGGVCLRFDAHNSPAIKEPRRLHFLTNAQDIEDAKKRTGVNHPNYLTYIRGFWPKITGGLTILSQVSAAKFRVREPHADGSMHMVTIAGCDPAFTEGGDEAILQFADIWREPNGKLVLDYGGENNTISIPIDAQGKDPEFYQVAYFCMEECKKRGVTPDCFAAETTGTGLGFGAILEKEWHPDIMQVSFSAQPTDEKTGFDLHTESKDVYDRRVTELWFQIQEYAEVYKLRGMGQIAVEEFCARQYERTGRKVKIETKKQYKLRTAGDETAFGSPDRADANVVVLELAKQRFSFSISDDDFVDVIEVERDNETFDITPTAWGMPKF